MIQEFCTLQRLDKEVFSHLLGTTPLNGEFLMVNIFLDKELPYVDVFGPLAAARRMCIIMEVGDDPTA